MKRRRAGVIHHDLGHDPGDGPLHRPVEADRDLRARHHQQRAQGLGVVLQPEAGFLAPLTRILPIAMTGEITVRAQLGKQGITVRFSIDASQKEYQVSVLRK